MTNVNNADHILCNVTKTKQRSYLKWLFVKHWYRFTNLAKYAMLAYSDIGLMSVVYPCNLFWFSGGRNLGKPMDLSQMTM